MRELDLPDYLFLLIGIVVQILVFGFSNLGIISLISGLAGIVAVVLVSQRRNIQYLFSFIQLFTYLYLAWQEKLYAEVGENIFYFVTMLYGMWSWFRNSDKGIVESRSLGKIKLTGVFGVMLASGIILWKILVETSDTQPFLDSFTTVPAFIAQILLILRYREQWIFWGIIDVGSIFMWWIAGDWCMVVQYIFWTANCIYGWSLWKTR